MAKLSPEQQAARTERRNMKERINDLLRTSYGYSENRIRQAWTGHADIEGAAITVMSEDRGRK